MVSRMGASATAGAVVSFLLAGVASAAGAVQQGPVPPEVTAQVPSVVVLGADEDAAPVDSTLVEMPVVVPDAVAGGPGPPPRRAAHAVVGRGFPIEQ